MEDILSSLLRDSLFIPVQVPGALLGIGKAVVRTHSSRCPAEEPPAREANTRMTGTPLQGEADDGKEGMDGFLHTAWKQGGTMKTFITHVCLT